MGDRVVRVALVAGACAAALALPAAPAAAAGETYFASSGAGPGEPCSEAAPCRIQDAVGIAGDGDAVSLAAGTYDLPFSGLTIENEIDFGASPGAPAVLLTTDVGNLHVTDKADPTLHDLRLEGEGGFELGSGTARRIFVGYVGVAENACELDKGTTLTDSVCWTRELSETVEGVSHAISIASTSEGQDEPVVLRNVTAFASNAAGDGVHALGAGGSKLTVDAANVIALSANGTDIEARKGEGLSEAHVNISHSSFSTFVDDPSSVSVTPPGTNGNISAAPSFVDSTIGDFHLKGGSPGLDGGVADGFVGSVDLDGADRSQPACFGTGAVPDMGAYERVATDACPPPPPPPPPPLEPRKPIFRVIKLTLNKRKGTGALQVELPSAGTLSMSGQGIKLVRRRAAAAGDLVILPIQPWAITRVRLAKRGRSRVKLKLLFEPRRGRPEQLSMGILLRKTRR
jgi:hypothetical protein